MRTDILLSLNQIQATRFGKALPPTAQYVAPTACGQVSCESLTDATTVLALEGKVVGSILINGYVEDKLSGKIVKTIDRLHPQDAYAELLALAADGSALVLWSGPVRLAEATATGDVKTLRTWQTSKLNWITGVWTA